MNLFDFRQLGWYNFQQLCLSIAREVLGQTVQQFLDSRDGGRDGAFAGRWKPSANEDLTGRFVIQCKFTSKPNNRLTLSDLADEIAKAKRLAQDGRCDCYLLMTNYDVSGVRDEKIESAFLAVGVKQFRTFGSDWISQQIRENSRLRMLVPRVYGLGDLSQILDERAYLQAHTVLDAMREDLSKVVLTRVYKKAITALDDHGFVLLLGEPACGKTTIAAMLAMAAIDQWHVATMKLETSQQVSQHWNPNEPKQFFWIDDAFGVTQYEQPLALEWNRLFAKISAMIEAGARVVLTSRDYIYRRAKQDLKETAFPLLRESQVVVDVRDITPKERQQILYNHLKLGNQPAAFRTGIKPFLNSIARHHRFVPEVARRLGNSTLTRGLVVTESNLKDFVEKPEQFLRDVIGGLDKHSRAALALIFMRNDELASPIAIQESEVSAFDRLGSNLGEVVTAVNALRDSITVLVTQSNQALWKFKHPTIGDAYGAIVLENPELMDIYIQGVSTEKLLATATCGDVGLQGALMISRAHFQRVTSKLDSFVARGLTERPGERRSRRWAVQMFLARRCDREFLANYMLAHPELYSPIRAPGLFLYAVPEVDLALRLFEFQTLPEDVRSQFVKAVTEYTVNGEDSYYFTNSKIREILNADETETLLTRLKTELIPNLADVRNYWVDNLPSDEDPEAYISSFLEIVSGLEEQLDLNDESAKAVEAQRTLVNEWIEEERSRVADSKQEEDNSEDYDDESGERHHDEAEERNVFDDVDA